MERLNDFKRNSEYGFTLIELVVTIIMIGIMAATIVPRLLTSKGFEEHVYRDELITKLRYIQLRAMQQSNDVTCQVIRVNASDIGLLATEINTNTCDSVLAGDTTTVRIVSDNDISFSISENLSSFRFSSMGRPVGCIAINPCKITLTITGSDALGVLINSEGYIYAL
ncbi:MAG: prepilin-type N-terminal cleavage/methylation domain-containing protein [Colwellia sp.]|nr:prepilin-type N-terminal cleavage/methylation domain-containing protein [Colwellia sp.]